MDYTIFQHRKSNYLGIFIFTHWGAMVAIILNKEMLMNTDFGPRIKLLRTQKGMTQLDLAKRLGVSKTIMSAYETGMRKPSYDVLMEMVLFFNVSMNWMFDSGDFDIDPQKVDLSTLSKEQQNLLHGLIDELRQTNIKKNATGAIVPHYWKSEIALPESDKGIE
jgi:transcriptional regulator with XRE-family HTH domain